MSRDSERLRRLEAMMYGMINPRPLDIIERRIVTMNGHPVQIFRDHTGEPKYYFRCSHCGTEYAVWKRDCKLEIHWTGESEHTHLCPKCKTKNTGYPNYRNGYGRNGYISSDCD